MESTASTSSRNYYAYLNVSQDASNEEIIAAYRKASRIYHPDKHQDLEKKKDAELIFNKVKRAYEVLSDPHARAIYDTLGEEGLQQNGWKLISRTKTPKEIREEYERLLRLKEEQYLEQRTHPRGSITVKINATDFFSGDESFREVLEGEDVPIPSPEIHSMSISQSIDAPLSLRDTATLSGSLSTKNGTGSGQVTASLRSTLSEKSWIESDLSIGQGPIVNFRGYRTLTKRQFLTGNLTFVYHSDFIHPGFALSTGRFLSKTITGYLTWKAGIQRLMNTTIVFDRKPHHSSIALQIGRPHSLVLWSYTHSLADENNTKLKVSVKAGTFGGLLEYGCDTKISQHSTLGASLQVGVPNGVILKIRLVRANQTYNFPIMLSDEVCPSPIFYGTVTPLLGYFLLSALIIQPYKERSRKMDRERKQRENAEALELQRQEAFKEIQLLMDLYNRLSEQERSIEEGLLVLCAFYGESETVRRIVEEAARTGQQSDSNPELPLSSSTPVIDVKVPLQCLVSSSKLFIPSGSKKNLQGFYDPCMADTKSLWIRYSHRNITYDQLFHDEDEVRIPR